MLQGATDPGNTISNCSASGEKDSSPPTQCADLFAELITLIIMRLGFVDYFACGGVCRAWRKIVKDNESTFLGRHHPLVIVKSKYVKRICLFYNVFDGTRYEETLPKSTVRMSVVGLSCGYLIMRGLENEFWLLNPLTRKALQFQLPPFYSSSLSNILLGLIYSKSLSEYLLVVVDELSSVVISSTLRPNWKVKYTGIADFVDLTFFNNKVYLLTHDARIGVLEVRYFHTHLELLNISISQQDRSMCTPAKLVASGESLFMVSYGGNMIIKEWVVIHKLDGMEWTRVRDLGEEALFISDISGGSAIVNPTKWGGRSNCVYALEASFNKWQIYSLERCRMMESGKIVEDEERFLFPHCWYFPCRSRNEID